MKIVVTGGCGFIGSHLVERLLKENHQVANIDCLTYAALPDIIPDTENYKLYYMDICERAVERVLITEQPDVILHLAAESHVDNSISSPKIFMQTNIMGTYSMLQAATVLNRIKGVKFIHVSTDEVFGSIEVGQFNENSKYDPRSPYSASKASSDHLVRAWHETYGLPTVITNCSNNFGPNQASEKLIPTIIRKAKNNEPIPIYGDGLNVRDWIYVEDHVSGLIRVMEAGFPGDTYLIGARNERTNLEIAKLILREIGKPESLIEFATDRPGHDFRYAIDPSKIEIELGWKAQSSFENAIKETILSYL